jgi:ectoine hydroxylase-related dioxygenase (phytanoyl-CoA dioxygenase family)
MLKHEIDSEGFAIAERVFLPEEITRLREALCRFRGSPQDCTCLRHVLHHPALREIASDPRLLALAEEILEARSSPITATLYQKTSSRSWVAPWHQDTVLPPPERSRHGGWGGRPDDRARAPRSPEKTLGGVLALRLHLEDSTEDNGPLRVLPSTHLHGILDDVTIHRLAGSLSPVRCVVPAGGVVVMRPLLVHASSRVRGAMPRHVLHIEYTRARDAAGASTLWAQERPGWREPLYRPGHHLHDRPI